MKEDLKPTLIGEIEFLDRKVQVYNDPYEKNKESGHIAWQARNPNSFYKGIIWVNLETGEHKYPEGAVIPIQTEEDREILPKFIITGNKKITKKFKTSIILRMAKGHKIRNGLS